MRSGSSLRQRGFTLLEVVIAFALLALALTFLLSSLSGAARQIRSANDAGRATLHAQTLLAQAGVGETLQPGTRQGSLEQGRYRWTLEVVPFVDPRRSIATPKSTSMPRLFELRLRMSWGSDRRQQFQWRTLRSVPADVNAP